MVLLLLLMISISIWVYTKYKREKKQRKLLAEENRQLQADNALLEADHLKFQLQPHTLNNILANLKVIADKLNTGMESLSNTLDYILYKGNTHLVSVADEIDFTKKYVALNGFLITEIDSIKSDYSGVNTGSKYYSSPCIPHLITAYFIENAFKHGDRNHPDFLKIHLKLSNVSFEMFVVNKIGHGSNNSKGGLGLNNMRQRLELLLSGKYEITNVFKEQEYHSHLIIRF